jgi:hypothetical protein
MSLTCLGAVRLVNTLYSAALSTSMDGIWKFLLKSCKASLGFLEKRWATLRP